MAKQELYRKALRITVDHMLNRKRQCHILENKGNQIVVSLCRSTVSKPYEISLLLNSELRPPLEVLYLGLGTALPKGGKPAEEKDRNKHERDMKRNTLQVYKKQGGGDSLFSTSLMDQRRSALSCHKETRGADFRKNFLKVMKEWKRLLEDTGEFPAVDVSKNRSDQWAMGIIWS